MFPSECFDLGDEVISARKGFIVISNVKAQRCQKQKELAEITFRGYLGETVLDILWNYFGETVRDILKDDFRKGFRREFEGETLWSL
jgi:hypothetical protein